ncbi:uncharacterized protein KLLA0_C15741g [Kluyveromyces lactis]|uniref:KLLA0C15741p n=1 Tax=Kluyveromyces lactis (strain ATCC 8585 / CBS 2359 / DSM 70799 / NBRC 1267 / NRRL Y-1140 / WM37) TaxID=284590 RepID=Q6CT36_KLULA|nr:uncharacterized protein KLLA0_C15741g [Kluyveromyces lactis]CAH01754.1 KLLA0C15741p [Kluyveromyces lactis]|eukprot:XP_452903.1 uncharacterized protein KLLA0_C15741g [Kluyveromyces lactis]
MAATANKKHDSQFRVATRIITEATITPLAANTSKSSGSVTDESDIDGGDALFSPFASDVGSGDDQDIERELLGDVTDDDDALDFEWLMGASKPKRFMLKPVTSEDHTGNAREIRHADISFSHALQGIIQPDTTDDVELPINEDFWKDVDTSVAEANLDMPLDFSAAISPSGANLSSGSVIGDHNGIDGSFQVSETVEDFIKTDTSISHSASTVGSDVHSQFMYPIKKLSFRDANGKLALDPQVSSVDSHASTSISNSNFNQSHHAHNRILKSGKRKSKFKKISRSKFGWCEMVSTGIGIGEFMLL